MNVTNVIEEINRGGFGIIEKVLCDDGQIYARKTFSPVLNPKITVQIINKSRNRFIREVKIQSRLQKEYIIPIVYFDINGNNPWYLMPVAEYDYNEEIKKIKSINKSPDGLADILNSLEYLHKLGYVHRDLKPGNILFHDGLWKLSDLGLITPDKDITLLSITSSNDWSGTSMYMAPEQITNFKHVDNRADIYSFGAILHDIYGNSPRTPYSSFSCNGEIGIILDKCSKKEPKKRFRDVEILRDKLLYLLSKNNISVSSTIQEQIDKFKNLSTFDFGKFEDLVFFLKDEDSANGQLFYELNNEIIDYLHNLDLDLFTEFCLIYIEWVRNTSFNFDYCDVIIKIIHNIYSKANDNDLKSKSVISAAEMARRHNRWFVMEYVVKMANPDINQHLALRIQIDLEIDINNKENFIRCIQGINKTKSNYHELIAQVI
ncbi:putative Serine/threonine protein kinase [Sphingobacterium sp. PM2-P1-29]|nr:putative Serine/threonine protein kinase [Sphingobacterium sp. PM2-P1-29]